MILTSLKSIRWKQRGLGVAGALLFLLLGRSQRICDNAATARDRGFEMPLLKFIEGELEDASRNFSPAKVELRGELPQIVSLAWTNDTSLLLLTHSPGFGVVKEAPVFWWTLTKKPQRLRDAEKSKLQFGKKVVFAHIFSSDEAGELDAALDWMEIIKTSPLILQRPRKRESSQQVSLPENTFVMDFGVTFADEGPRSKDWYIYDRTGQQIVHLKQPQNVWVWHPTEYSLQKVKDGWQLAFACVSREQELKYENPPTRICVLTLSSEKEARILQQKILSPSLPLFNNLPSVQSGQKPIEYTFTIDHPCFSETHQRWLVRRVCNAGAPNINEEAAFTELWSLDKNGQDPQMLDIQGWYRSDRSGASHEYLFRLEKGKVNEQFHKFKMWGPFREMIPSLSPDGKRVAYLRDNVICVRDLEK